MVSTIPFFYECWNMDHLVLVFEHAKVNTIEQVFSLDVDINYFMEMDIGVSIISLSIYKVSTCWHNQ